MPILLSLVALFLLCKQSDISVSSFSLHISRCIKAYSSMYSSTLCMNSANGKEEVALPGTYEADLVEMHKDQSHANHVFCNVELNCENLEAVGFDMDFTLAQYNDDFNKLAFEGAKQKLVNNLGYPKEVLDFQYEPERFRRGLIIDKKRGNILKIDRHKYVRKVYHGTQELTARLRKAIYTKQVTTFTEVGIGGDYCLSICLSLSIYVTRTRTLFLSLSLSFFLSFFLSFCLSYIIFKLVKPKRRKTNSKIH